MTRERAVEMLETFLHKATGPVGILRDDEESALRFAIRELERGKPGVWEVCHDPTRVIHPGTSPKEET